MFFTWLWMICGLFWGPIFRKNDSKNDSWIPRVCSEPDPLQGLIWIDLRSCFGPFMHHFWSPFWIFVDTFFSCTYCSTVLTWRAYNCPRTHIQTYQGVLAYIQAYLIIFLSISTYLDVSNCIWRIWTYLAYVHIFINLDVSKHIYLYLHVSAYIWAYLGISARVVRIWVYLGFYLYLAYLHVSGASRHICAYLLISESIC